MWVDCLVIDELTVDGKLTETLFRHREEALFAIDLNTRRDVQISHRQENAFIIAGHRIVSPEDLYISRLSGVAPRTGLDKAGNFKFKIDHQNVPIQCGIYCLCLPAGFFISKPLKIFTKCKRYEIISKGLDRSCLWLEFQNESPRVDIGIEGLGEPTCPVDYPDSVPGFVERMQLAIQHLLMSAR